ncbi:MAG: glycosyl transferase family 1 [Candidatus Moranbacteria bacterium CG10_big_fil_rev_8_21_14_0_10_35_21]|nr:MAG: glycosyl transferase family 1 [Candidatus Moranbacteria bacterium CG10_big_fil_rev_8_21_14_0_10_35_21]PJA88394.1 MAG: glycosyl transferase family 1 [Candidatus Moranbacteria bacterium CG_4_9_14_3_um_filter_36_9]
MKIAFIGQKGIPAKQGGVEKHVEELASRLAQNGHEVFVYVRNNYTSQKIENYKGIHLIHLPSLATKNLDAISHTFLATCHALFQKYDLISYQAIGPSSLSFIIKFFKPKTALTATYHCQDYFHKKWGVLAKAYLKFGEYIACRVPDATFAVSKTLKKFILVKFSQEAIYIPNGMNVQKNNSEDFLASQRLVKNQYILSVSRLIKHKGIHYLIEAFQKLSHEGKAGENKLVIVGDGFYTDNYVASLKKLAKQDKNILFLGERKGSELSQLFSHCKFFVQPSESEGISIALIEAMGYEKAVLVSNIPESLEVLPDFNFSFQSGDVLDLELKLEYLLKNPEKLIEAGLSSRRKAEAEYDWDNLAKEYENKYQEIINQKTN